MPHWIPERPAYKKEHRTVGFMLLAVFLLLLGARTFSHLFSFYKIPWLIAPVMALISFAAPPLAYIFYRGRSYPRMLRLQPPRHVHLPLLIFAFIALFCGTFLLSSLTGGLDTLGNSVAAFTQNTPETVWELLLSLLTVGAVPALLEAFCMFGIAAVEYERRGAYRAILLCTLLFALLHFDAANLLAYLFAGALYVLILYATGSLIAVGIIHTLYVVISLLVHRYLVALYHFTGTVQLFLFFFIVLALSALILFCRSAARIYRARDERGLRDPKRDVPYNVQFYTLLDALCDPAVILCLAVAIAGFILL